MVTIPTVLMLLSAGGHVVMTDDCGCGTYRVLTRVFQRFGVTATFVDTSDPSLIKSALRHETRMLLVATMDPFLKQTYITAMGHGASPMIWPGFDGLCGAGGSDCGPGAGDGLCGVHRQQ